MQKRHIQIGRPETRRGRACASIDELPLAHRVGQDEIDAVVARHDGGMRQVDPFSLPGFAQQRREGIIANSADQSHIQPQTAGVDQRVHHIAGKATTEQVARKAVPFGVKLHHPLANRYQVQTHAVNSLKQGLSSGV